MKIDKKKLIIIGASYLQLPLIHKAKSMDIETHVFAWEDGAVGKEYCDYFYPISITEKEEILKVARTINPDGIISIASDLAMHTVNFLAQELGLKGNTIACTDVTTNKFRMREQLLEHDILCPKYVLYGKDNELDLDNYDFTYPAIVKPTDRSGSRGIFKVSSLDELKSAVERSLEESFSKNVIIEEFISGKEISVEEISWKGKHFYLTATDKVTTGAPNFVEMEHHQPALLSEKVSEQLVDLINRALTALGVTYGASHSEVIITEVNELYIVEIGARMGGDFIGSDLVELSTGFDFVRGVIEVALGTFDPAVLKKEFLNDYSGVYFAKQRNGTVKEITNRCSEYKEVVRDEVMIKEGDQIQDIIDSSTRVGYFIYKSGNKFIQPEPLIGFTYQETELK